MLRTTVVAKTDLVKSTQHIRSLTAPELEGLLASQVRIFTPIIEQHQGSVLKGEGDSFWLTFPSVTAAAVAAIDMQRALRHDQLNRSEQNRLAMRVTIALGDLLEQGGDLFGPAMALVARIEGITPADEIYLSHAAWLVLNHAEIETVLVDSFTLKGFDQPEHIYRVVQRDVIRVERDQIVVGSDLVKFSQFVNAHPYEVVGAMLSQHEALAMLHLTTTGGKVRVLAGDSYITTFDHALEALSATESWVEAWVSYLRDTGYNLPIRVGVTKGPYYMFRTHLFGDTINGAIWLARLASALRPMDYGAIFISTEVHTALQGTAYEARLSAVTNMPESERFKNKPAITQAYQLVMEEMAAQ